MISASAALERLRTGNLRFAAGEACGAHAPDQTYRAAPAEGQRPIAVVLGCSDSRVSPEILFDQGLGDLFVIRVAGNIVTPALLGSVELATSQLGTRLVVVLGHSRCAAVLATLEELAVPTENQSQGMMAIIDRVRPAVAPLLEGDPPQDRDALVREAVRRNVLASVEELRNRSPTIQREVREGGLLVVGAEYSLETGVVEFLDGESEAD